MLVLVMQIRIQFPSTCAAWICALSLHAAFAQSPGTSVDIQTSAATPQEKQQIVKEVLRLRDDGKIISKDEIMRQLEDPKPEPVRLLEPRTEDLTTAEIVSRARAANLRVGYVYLCPRCDDWHVNLAGGYAISEDVIVTCGHVVNTRTKMREGYLVALDEQGRVAGAEAILAWNADMDVAIVKVSGAKFTPVALNRNVTQGDPAYCFSHPLNQRGYFSTGNISRFYWNNSYAGEDKESMDALLHLRADFSNQWAPGSSGSPLLDRAGNVIAHVSTISGLGRGKNQPPLLTLGTGIPAQCVQRLVDAIQDPDEIKRLASYQKSKEQEASDKHAKESGEPVD